MSVLALASKFTPWFNSFDMQSYLYRFDYVWFPSGLAEFTWVYVVFGITFAIWFQRALDKAVVAIRELIAVLVKERRA